MNIVEPIRRKKDLKKIESILRKQSLRDLLLFTIGTNCGLRRVIYNLGQAFEKVDQTFIIDWQINLLNHNYSTFI